MELIEKKDNQIVFKAEIDETFANSIRRYISKVPVLAIDELEISNNDSPLYDETIAHRIGLIPLKMDKSINEKSVVEFKLSVKKEGMVNSGELKGKLDVVYPDIPITFLNKGQELEIIATAKVGRGDEHSKFLPGLMFYRNAVDVKIEKNCPQEVIKFCPQDILKLKDGKVTITDVSKCDMCDVCIELCEKIGKKDAISINPTNELIITVESFGQLDVKEIFKRSIEELKKDLKEISSLISKA